MPSSASSSSPTRRSSSSSSPHSKNRRRHASSPSPSPSSTQQHNDKKKSRFSSFFTKNDDSSTRRNEALCFRLVLIILGIVIIAVFCSFDFGLQSLRSIVTPQGSVKGYLSRYQHVRLSGFSNDNHQNALLQPSQKAWINSDSESSSVANRNAFTSKTVSSTQQQEGTPDPTNYYIDNKVTLLQDVCEKSSIVFANSKKSTSAGLWCVGPDRQSTSLQLKRIDVSSASIIRDTTDDKKSTSSFKQVPFENNFSISSMWVTSPVSPLASIHTATPFPADSVEILSVVELEQASSTTATASSTAASNNNTIAVFLLRDVSFNSIYSAQCIFSASSSSSTVSSKCSDAVLVLNGNTTDSTTTLSTDSCKIDVIPRATATASANKDILVASCTSENKKVRSFTLESADGTYSYQDSFTYSDSDVLRKASPKFFVAELSVQISSSSSSITTLTTSNLNNILSKSWSEIPQPTSLASPPIANLQICSFSDVFSVSSLSFPTSSAKDESFLHYALAIVNDTDKNEISALIIDLTDSISTFSSSSSSSSTPPQMKTLDGSFLSSGNFSSLTFGEFYSAFAGENTNNNNDNIANRKWTIDRTLRKHSKNQQTHFVVSFLLKSQSSPDGYWRLLASFNYDEQTSRSSGSLQFPDTSSSSSSFTTFSSSTKPETIIISTSSSSSSSSSSSLSSENLLLVQSGLVTDDRDVFSSSASFSSSSNSMTAMTTITNNKDSSSSSLLTNNNDKFSQRSLFVAGVATRQQNQESSSSSSSSDFTSGVFSVAGYDGSENLLFNLKSSSRLQCPLGDLQQQAIVHVFSHHDTGDMYSIVLACSSYENNVVSIVSVTEPASTILGSWNTDYEKAAFISSSSSSSTSTSSKISSLVLKTLL